MDEKSAAKECIEKVLDVMQANIDLASPAGYDDFAVYMNDIETEIVEIIEQVPSSSKLKALYIERAEQIEKDLGNPDHEQDFEITRSIVLATDADFLAKLIRFLYPTK